MKKKQNDIEVVSGEGFNDGEKNGVVNVYTTEEQGSIVAYIDEGASGDFLKFCRN